MADNSRQTRGGHKDRGHKDVPQVSVIMPCYNAATTIKAAVDSALAQRLPLEVIILDDCSTDETELVLSSYDSDARVRVIHNEQRLGAAKSRNKGVKFARAPLVAFLDADDLWREDKLARQIRELGRTGAVLCCTGRELIRSDGSADGRVIGVKTRISYRDELKTNWINCSSVLLPRETALAYPMAHEDAHEDYISWLIMLRERGDACGINEPLLLYRISSKGKSGSKWKSARMTFRSYRYAGLGVIRSLLCFCSYTIHGLVKYSGRQT